MRAYERGGPEFNRVLAFSDGVFAIAMTLLVFGIAVPDVADDKLGDALVDRIPHIVSFFISFVVIGRYWIAHHQAFAQLRVLSGSLIGVNLVYLAVIAFLPFPSALIGQYEDTALAVVLFAIALGVASFLEAVSFSVARRTGALARDVPDREYRFSLLAQLVPVAVFAISIPIAFLNSTAALLSWLLTFPAEIVLGRWGRERADKRSG